MRSVLFPPCCILLTLLASALCWLLARVGANGRLAHRVECLWGASLLWCAGVRLEADLSALDPDGVYVFMMGREVEKLNATLGGIKDMDKLPQAAFIIDPKREEIAVQECRKLGIPVVAVVDTNCDPDVIDYVIPGNDDAIRAIKLFATSIGEACLEGAAQNKDAAPATPDKDDKPEPEPQSEETPEVQAAAADADQTKTETTDE